MKMVYHVVHHVVYNVVYHVVFTIDEDMEKFVQIINY